MKSSGAFPGLPAALFREAAEKYNIPLPEAPSDSLVFGIRLDDGQPPEPGYLTVPSDTSPVFLNEAMRQSERCGRWLAGLDTCLERGADPQELLDRSEELLGEPIFVVDPSMKRIAASRKLSATDSFFQEIVSQGYPTLDTYDRLNRDNFYDPQYYSGSVQHLRTNEQPSHDVALKGIRVEGKLAATALMIFQNSPWSETRVALFSLLADRLAVALKSPWVETDARSEQYDFLLRDLLEGKELSSAEIDARIRYTGRSNPCPCHVVLFEAADNSRAKLGYLCRVLDSVFPNTRPLIHQQYVITMLPVRGGNRDEALNRLEQFCSHTDCRCAVSARMADMAGMAEHYRQATEALLLGRRLSETDSWYRRDCRHGRERCFSHDDLAPYCAILNYTNHRNAANLCRSEFRELRQADAENGTDDLRVLFHYLTGGMNYTEAARQLFMHRNSVFYRISRILERLGVNEIDPVMAKGLLFSYMVEDVVSAFSTNSV